MNARWPRTLPCGSEVATLIVQVADGVDGDLAHQADCEHCQQVLATLHELWDAVGELAAEQVSAPSSVDRAVMRRVRRDLFVSEAMRLVGGILPRLSRALFVYTGLMGEQQT